ncbi:MAG: hypothetical protein HY530_03515 [Chloroflexi bacterium]|nr:hypothetical protein [Chloroflexota bacterium]
MSIKTALPLISSIVRLMFALTEFDHFPTRSKPGVFGPCNVPFARGCARVLNN